MIYSSLIVYFSILENAAKKCSLNVFESNKVRNSDDWVYLFKVNEKNVCCAHSQRIAVQGLHRRSVTDVLLPTKTNTGTSSLSGAHRSNRIIYLYQSIEQRWRYYCWVCFCLVLIIFFILIFLNSGSLPS